jgi:hypothetical protein
VLTPGCFSSSAAGVSWWGCGCACF